jgi:iron complex transport system substrate-binding protein
MTGRPTPRRPAARQDLPLRRWRTHPPLVLLAVLLLFMLVAAGAFVAGCGSSGLATTTTAVGPETTSSTAAGSSTATTASTASTVATSTSPSTGVQTAEGTFPVTVTDDNGNSVTIKSKPARIVSTAPASTETLFALGVGDRVVGVTSLDDYPPEAANITKIGDFQANTEAIMGVSPDLVIGYSGNEEPLAPVQSAGAAVIIFNPATLDGIYNDITIVGAATGATGKAAELVDSIKAQVKTVTDQAATIDFSPKVFYALDNTLWTAGPGSFVDELLKLVGATNVGSMPGAASAATQAYYQFAPEQLIAADPDVILLPNTAYKSIDEFVNDPRFSKLTAVQLGHVYLINDVIVTRPGPRIAEGLQTLFDAVHPADL